MVWVLLHPKMTPEHLGLIPGFLDEDDPAPAKEQFNRHYIAGWGAFTGFTFNKDNSISYPGDPTMPPLAMCQFRDELILFYDHAWVAIKQKDGSVEICRMD